MRLQGRWHDRISWGPDFASKLSAQWTTLSPTVSLFTFPFRATVNHKLQKVPQEICCDFRWKRLLSAHSTIERSQTSYNALVSLLSLLPFASTAGVLLGARALLLGIFLLLALMVFVVFVKVDLAGQDRLFVTVTACISLTLLLSSSSTSTNLHGWDIHGEFNIFLHVLRSGYWRPDVAGTEVDVRYAPALSISILPVMVSLVSGLDGVRIFESILPAVFSIAPLILYKTYRKIMSPSGAFLAVFLFMSYPSFYVEMVTLGRQEVAELLLILLLWILFSPKIRRGLSGQAVMLLLGIGILLAHYSIGYILVSALIFAFVLSRISKKVLPPVGGSVVALLVVIGTSWYFFTAGGVAVSVLIALPYSVLNGLLGGITNPASRPTLAMQALGLANVIPGFLHIMNRLSQYLVQLSIVLGLVVFMRRRESDLASRSMLPLMIFGFVMLVFAVVLPNFAFALNLTRIYQIGLIFLAPCFVFGAQALESGVRRTLFFVPRPLKIRMHSSRRLTPAVLLLLYFLFISGWVWAATMDSPTSTILDAQRSLTYPGLSLRVGYYTEFTAPRDIAGALWIQWSGLASGRSICADAISTSHVLNSYGELPRSDPQLPFNFEARCRTASSYVFLSELNTRYHVLANDDATSSPIANVSERLIVDNLLYSNGATMIYGPNSS